MVLMVLSAHDTAAARRHDYPHKPPAEIEHALGILKLHELHPQKLSVTFWSSDDAESRMQNIYEANRARFDPTLTHIGVNLSDSDDVFHAYLKRDNIANEKYQLRATPEMGRQLLDTYGYSTLYQ